MTVKNLTFSFAKNPHYITSVILGITIPIINCIALLLIVLGSIGCMVILPIMGLLGRVTIIEKLKE